MKGYKGFNSDLTCRGFQYKIGETFTTDEPISLCNKGYHFCTTLSDTFKFYYPDYDNIYCEVEASGEIQEGGDKCVSSEIKIIRIIPKSVVNRTRYGYGDGDGYGYGDGFGRGDGCGDGNNGRGCGDGNGDGYGFGCGFGSGCGYGYGYGKGYTNGCGNGGGYGDGDGCGDGCGNGKGKGNGRNIYESILLK